MYFIPSSGSGIESGAESGGEEDTGMVVEVAPADELEMEKSGDEAQT